MERFLKPSWTRFIFDHAIHAVKFMANSTLSSIHFLVREINPVLERDGIWEDDKRIILDAIEKFDSVLGIFGKAETEVLDAEIEQLIEDRNEARRTRNFAKSDEIRDSLAEKGIILEDTKDGVRWKRQK